MMAGKCFIDFITKERGYMTIRQAIKLNVLYVVAAAALVTVQSPFGGVLTVCAEEYEYDDLNRVVKVIYDDGGYVEYLYDSNGNIVKVTVHKAESSNPDGSSDSKAGEASEESGDSEASKESGDSEASEESETSEESKESGGSKGSEVSGESDDSKDSGESEEADGRRSREEAGESGGRKDSGASGESGGRKDSGASGEPGDSGATQIPESAGQDEGSELSKRSFLDILKFVFMAIIKGFKLTFHLE